MAPAHVLGAGLRLARAAITLGDLQQPLGAVLAAVQHHVFAGLAQVRIDALINRKLAGIDDAHIHARLDGVVEEDGMHLLAHRLVAAEGEGEVRHPARDMHQRHFLPDRPRRFDEVDAVIVVFLDARRDRKDIRIEDDVFRRKARLVRQNR